MCDGDDEIGQGLYFDKTIFVNGKGQIRNDNMNVENDNNNWFELKNVHSCMGGLSIADILPLIGHDRDNLYRFMENDDQIILPPKTPSKSQQQNMTDIHDDDDDDDDGDIIDKLKKSSRPPGAYLVSDGNQLYGVTIVDDQNENFIYGPVTMIIPNVDGQNVLVIERGKLRDVDTNYDEQHTIKFGNFQLQTTNQINLDQILQNNDQNYNVNVGIVSINGFLLIAQNHLNFTEFILILDGGYILTYDIQINWIRANVDQQTIIMNDNQRQEQNVDPVKCTKIGHHEVFICLKGALVYANDDNHINHGDSSTSNHNDNQNRMMMMNLIGTNNAVINYDAFKHFILNGQHRVHRHHE
nr:uncharacterized protein LOC124494877 isoform X1 [Dermatophagoides farinae]